MATATVELVETQNRVSEYPEEMNVYFEKKKLMIKVVPNDIDASYEIAISDFLVTTADDYYRYLVEQIAFWDKHDGNDTLVSITQHNRLKTAMSYFESAVKHYRNNQRSQGENNLNNSFSTLSQGCLHSNTFLADFVIRFADSTQNFISGLKKGLQKTRNNSQSYSVDELEGVITALNYRNSSITLQHFSPEAIQLLQQNADEANRKYADLSGRYTKSFEEHEKQMKSVETQTNQHFDTFECESRKNHEAAEQRLKELETLYEEKLKLQAPAQYWDKMESDYNNSGGIWLICSGILSFIMVTVLICMFKSLPNELIGGENLMYLFKSSAIITITTSVGVYLLRLMVKMATSSFHLARDAKERSKLSYFYLALIENKAVTEKERAIVLNALFSRADTGLLKGDSTPVMSGNVTDLVTALSKAEK